MAAAIVQTQRVLPYGPRDLCKLVGDVRSYPHFIPWIKSLRVLKETPDGDGWKGLAQAFVGWRAISESFTTHVHSDPEGGVVTVSLADGPFRTLDNRWRFKPAPNGGTTVDFWIAYEFKNPVLQALVRANGKLAAERIMRAFEAEAARRFAKSEPSGNHAAQEA